MYGANPVFDKISLGIHDGDRIGLVGRNGSGKTTLFKLLAGIESADKGEVHVRKGAKVGYLAQIPEDAVKMTVKEVLRQPFGEVLATEKQMEKVAGEMAGPAASDAEQLNRLLAKYDELQQAFEWNGGYEMESEIQKVINGLGIDEGFLERPYESLSGGEQTKVGLAAALLEEPDLLLLDEPTNHLDLAAIEWLENFLRSYKGAVMLVSHDRYFLDRTVTRVFDLRTENSPFTRAIIQPLQRKKKNGYWRNSSNIRSNKRKSKK
ncbi:MAG TPA: ATP-binding cassette domain-containing protein [Bacillales bacterium]